MKLIIKMILDVNRLLRRPNSTQTALNYLENKSTTTKNYTNTIFTCRPFLPIFESWSVNGAFVQYHAKWSLGLERRLSSQIWISISKMVRLTTSVDWEAFGWKWKWYLNIIVAKMTPSYLTLTLKTNLKFNHHRIQAVN